MVGQPAGDEHPAEQREPPPLAPPPGHPHIAPPIQAPAPPPPRPHPTRRQKQGRSIFARLKFGFTLTLTAPAPAPAPPIPTPDLLIRPTPHPVQAASANLSCLANQLRAVEAAEAMPSFGYVRKVRYTSFHLE